MQIDPLTAHFGARVTGVDIASPLDFVTFKQIRQAFDDYSILIFPDQALADQTQIAFSERFGPCEPTVTANPAKGTVFARQSNLDIKTGEPIPLDDRRMAYQKANYLWHSDSSFKAIPSLCSILSAREVPPEGGATEFASTRAAYASLSDEQKAELDALVVEHDFVRGRALVGYEYTPEERSPYPPVRHKLVRTNAGNGKKSVLVGAHASSIVGWPEEKSRALLDDLLERATIPENCLRHEWRTGDVIVWDNQAAVHRATAYDAAKHRRLMQRTTISSQGAWPEFQA